MKCFLCVQSNVSFSSNSLISHLKSDHILKGLDFFVCSEKGCFQKFQNIYTFKRHLQRVHENKTYKSKTNPTSYEQPQTTLNFYKESDLSTTSVSPINIIKDNIPTNFLQTELTNAFPDELAGIVFALSLHNNDNFNRKNVSDIIEKVLKNVINPLIRAVALKIVPLVEAENNRASSIHLLDELCIPFKSVNTEYKLMQELETKNLFKKPLYYTINDEVCEVIVNSIPTLDSSKVTGVIMPLEFQIQQYFQCKNVLLETLDNTNMLNNSAPGVYSSILNGTVWKEKARNFEGKLIIPFILFLDDFCIDNPLGSHAKDQSICGVYYSFPTIPKHHLSKLKNIFVAGFFKTKDRSLFGNSFAIKPFVERIKSLETHGLDVHVNDKSYHLYFVLAFVTGDNLGLNTYLGFSASFNSNFYCRVCKRSKLDMQSDVIEHPSFLRNHENYEADLQAKSEKLTGIKEKCVFNEINSFHVTQNFYFDIMHDIFEGICRYDVSKILVNFIETSKFFSIDVLNDRKLLFDYGETETGNISTPFVLSLLKVNNLKMTARETMTLIHFLPLMIGDLVPENNKVWELLITLVKIIDLILLSEIDEVKLKSLKHLISKHNTLFINIFKEPLKPKFHFLVHYPSAIRKCGPLKILWCMRFEALHRLNKQSAKATNSRVNISYTLAFKAGLKFSDTLVKQNFFENTFIFDEKSVYTHNLNLSYKNINYNNLSIGHCEVKCISKLTYKGKTYKEHFFLTKIAEKSQLFEIQKILIDESKYYFLCQEWNIKYFSEHIQAFVIDNRHQKISLHSVTEFNSPPIHIHYLQNGLKVFRSKMT